MNKIQHCLNAVCKHQCCLYCYINVHMSKTIAVCTSVSTLLWCLYCCINVSIMQDPMKFLLCITCAVGGTLLQMCASSSYHLTYHTYVFCVTLLHMCENLNTDFTCASLVLFVLHYGKCVQLAVLFAHLQNLFCLCYIISNVCKLLCSITVHY